MILLGRYTSDTRLHIPDGIEQSVHEFYQVLDWFDKLTDVYICRGCGCMFGHKKGPIVPSLHAVNKKCRRYL